MQRIGVILGSTRQNRFGERVAQWVMAQLSNTAAGTFQLLDLRDYALPFYDEPKPASDLNMQYSNSTAQTWCDTIAQYNGFIFITPEYNHAYPAVLKNAIDYLWEPWQGKPFVIVSYSTGAIGGARAAEQLRNLLNYMGLHGRGELNLTNAKKQLPADTAPTTDLTERLHHLVNKLTS